VADAVGLSRGIRLIDAGTVARALDLPRLIEALRVGHREGVEAFGRMLLEQPSAAGDTDRLLGYAAWQRGRAFGIKLASVFPDNAASDVPTVASVYVLFDGPDGRPRAVMDAAPLTLRKTGADSALAADYLARRDVRTLLMVGAGAQAPWLIAAHRVVRPSLARILIWNRTQERAASLARSLAKQGLDAHAVADLKVAVGEADVISCVTASPTPLVRGDWLRPGTHVDLVGGFTPTMREADDEAIRRSRIYVDTRWFTLRDAGDICQPLRDGIIGERDIIADLFELVRGEGPGRRNDDEITLFKNAGGGHLDLMAATLVDDST
jgi:ornithine cyclodeaminase